MQPIIVCGNFQGTRLMVARPGPTAMLAALVVLAACADAPQQPPESAHPSPSPGSSTTGEPATTTEKNWTRTNTFAGLIECGVGAAHAHPYFPQTSPCIRGDGTRAKVDNVGRFRKSWPPSFLVIQANWTGRADVGDFLLHRCLEFHGVDQIPDMYHHYCSAGVSSPLLGFNLTFDETFWDPNVTYRVGLEASRLYRPGDTPLRQISDVRLTIHVTECWAPGFAVPSSSNYNEAIFRESCERFLPLPLPQGTHLSFPQPRD